MSLDAWSVRNELLNEFQSAIDHRTHGRLSHLSLHVSDGALIVEARSATYYSVQLALAAIKAFTDEYPKLTPAIMSFRVDGHPLLLRNSQFHDMNKQVTCNDDSLNDDDTFVTSHHDESSSSPLSPAVATATAS